MTTRDALQLGAALVFPLGVLTLLLASVACERGRTRGEIVKGVLAIVTCLAGVVAVGVGLAALRGGALIDYQAGSLGLGIFGYVDAAGIVACAGLLAVALMVVRRLTATGGAPAASDTEN